MFNVALLSDLLLLVEPRASGYHTDTDKDYYTGTIDMCHM